MTVVSNQVPPVQLPVNEENFKVEAKEKNPRNSNMVLSFLRMADLLPAISIWKIPTENSKSPFFFLKIVLISNEIDVLHIFTSKFTSDTSTQARNLGLGQEGKPNNKKGMFQCHHF